MGRKSKGIQYHTAGVPWGQRPSSAGADEIRLSFGSAPILVVPKSMALAVDVPVNLTFGIALIEVIPRPLTLAVGTEVQLGFGTAGIEVIPQSMSLLVGEEVKLTFGIAVIEVVPRTIYLSTGDEPVYKWNAPDRQCDPRVTAKDEIVVMQPYEKLWLAFDFADVMDNHGASLTTLIYLQDDQSNDWYSGEVIVEDQVRFIADIPAGIDDADLRLEVAVEDSKNNRHVVDGILRIRNE